MDRNRSDSKYPRYTKRVKYYSQEYIISEIEIVEIHRKNGFAEDLKF